MEYRSASRWLVHDFSFGGGGGTDLRESSQRPDLVVAAWKLCKERLQYRIIERLIETLHFLLVQLHVVEFALAGSLPDEPMTLK